MAQTNLVQILNNNTLVIEDLDIGTNNNLGHTDFTPVQEASFHGWELGMSNAIRNNCYPYEQIYILKAGQGGSTISEWNTGGTYYNTFVTRYNAFKTQIDALEQEYYPVFALALGVNDEIAGTDRATFKANVQAFVNNLRTTVGYDAQFLVAELPPVYASYDSLLTEIAEADRGFTKIETTDLSLKNISHWDYEGNQDLADRMLDRLNLNCDVDPEIITASSLDISITDSIQGKVGGVFYAGQDGLIKEDSSFLHIDEVNRRITLGDLDRSFTNLNFAMNYISGYNTFFGGSIAYNTWLTMYDDTFIPDIAIPLMIEYRSDNVNEYTNSGVQIINSDTTDNNTANLLFSTRALSTSFANPRAAIGALFEDHDGGQTTHLHFSYGTTKRMQLENDGQLNLYSSEGIVMESPNGSCWRVQVDDTGTLITTSATCPN